MLLLNLFPHYFPYIPLTCRPEARKCTIVQGQIYNYLDVFHTALTTESYIFLDITT
jgi:hypothetical protein